MLQGAYNFFLYGTIFLSLFLIDYILGNGFIDIFQRTFCKIMCVIKKSIEEEQMTGKHKDTNDVSFTVLLTEVLVLGCTIIFLNKYKEFRCGRDRIDELLQESREALQQTNDFLEKWRKRRLPTEFSYLDEEPQEIKPLKLEVPILHMAIVDTLSTNRNKLERGDAGDTINITDSTILSVTSLIDENLQSIIDPTDEEKIEESKKYKNNEINSRYLWDVVEEDSNYLEE